MSNRAKHRAIQEAPEKKGMVDFRELPGDPPPYDEIAALAYSYWEARGHNGGSAEDDWLRAEEELRKRHARMRASEQPAAAAKGAGA